MMKQTKLSEEEPFVLGFFVVVFSLSALFVWCCLFDTLSAFLPPFYRYDIILYVFVYDL